jgi:predicted RNase H-like HicB family nuclease
MTTIEAIIERAKDGTYSVYCKHEIFSGAGASIGEAKEDMYRQMSFYKETALAEGFKYPAFLDDEYMVSYHVDMPSLLKYYVEAGILSLAGVEKMTGINQKQLWSYLNGTKPRKPQSERMEKGFRALMNDLDAVFASA